MTTLFWLWFAGTLFSNFLLGIAQPEKIPTARQLLDAFVIAAAWPMVVVALLDIAQEKIRGLDQPV